MLFVFTAAVFLSATLLFLVQPMVARLVLPLLGGTPSVWNTCMVFFQTLLLLGYTYAHLLSRLHNARTRVTVHAVVGLATLIALPIGLPHSVLVSGQVPQGQPALWLLGILALTAGAPFALISSTGPLLQRWFSDTTHRAASDPYFLYAASNTGSLLALLSYPLIVEPTLTLRAQTIAWSIAYALLVLLLVTAGVLHVRSHRPVSFTTHDATTPSTPHTPSEQIPRERLWWILLAAAPSSLMLGATSYISTDLAAVPLLWVGPLALYLISMIAAFSRFGPRATRLATRALPACIIALVVSMLISATSPLIAIITLHLLVLLAAATACHGRLAALRPNPARLTEYFLLISVGGAIGGLFNAVIAPLIFTRVAEYPIALVLACGLGLCLDHAQAGKERAGHSPRWRQVFFTVSTAVAVTGLLVLMSALSERANLPSKWQTHAVAFALPALAWYLTLRRPVGFVLTLAGFLAVVSQSFSSNGFVVYAHRSFFGVLRVVQFNNATTTDAQPRPDAPVRIFHQLLHGSTAHGLQFVDPILQDTPLTYYHPKGPAGAVFTKLTNAGRLHHVGLVGLGTGALAAYGQPGHKFTFFEIDSSMRDMASDPDLFTYLQRSKAEVDIQIGDGRRLLAQYNGQPFDLIVLDAFSSDAIPIHLMTVEAVRTYFSKLSQRGVVLVHISNRHLHLLPVLRGIARTLNIVGREDMDDPAPRDIAAWAAEGRYPCQWVVLARSERDFDFLGPDARWLKFLPPKSPDPVWTDDFSNITSVLRIGL